MFIVFFLLFVLAGDRADVGGVCQAERDESHQHAAPQRATAGRTQ